MTLVFVSNFFNHHQKPLSDVFYSFFGNNYYFIETEPINEERLKLGWGKEEKPSYVKQSYVNDVSLIECQNLIDNADIVIFGSAPYDMLKNRLKNQKITFKYSERIYKKGCPYYKLPKHFWIHYKKYIKHKNIYLLCASAFASADYAKSFTFLNKAYKWGYFPEFIKHEVDELIKLKKPGSILWVGRYIDWKHPEVAVEIARKLKNDGYNFDLNMIGTGPLEGRIKSIISTQGLNDCIHVLGAMKPHEVRKHMEESEIFLFTSDRNEGWGAVLNESMNSCCAVVASHSIGSVPYLITNDENGYIYKCNDTDDLYIKIKKLLHNPQKRYEFATKAYNTIRVEWNAETAVKKFLILAESLLSCNRRPFPFAEGVCSKAEIIRDDWI